MAQALIKSRVVCGLCMEDFGDVGFTFKNCGHVVCDKCNEGIEAAKADPNIPQINTYNGSYWTVYPGAELEYLIKDKCVICGTEGQKIKLYFEQEEDLDKRKLMEKNEDLEKRLSELEVRERSLYEDVRPEVGQVEVSEDDRPEVGQAGATNPDGNEPSVNEAAIYCVRCGSKLHIAKNCTLTSSQGKLMKQNILSPNEFDHWQNSKRAGSRRHFEKQWNYGKPIPKSFYEAHYHGQAYTECENNWVKKL